MKKTYLHLWKLKTSHKVAPGFLMLLFFVLFSVPASAGTGKNEGITFGEIAMYVVLIAAVVAVAWFFTMGGKKSKTTTGNSGTTTQHHHHHTPKHHHKHHRR